MKKRVVVFILDGFGVGYMDDVSLVRKQDYGTNTAKSILESFKDLKIANLCKLGLMNLLGFETEYNKFSEKAIFGKAKLQHHGADTFLGHQEIMGTHVKKPLIAPFSKYIDKVEEALQGKGYKVERKGEKAKFLWVDDCVAIGDNLETDLGQVYNLTTTFNKISFEKELEIGSIVRKIVEVSRVIVFGGTNATVSSILKAHREIDGYSGIDAPKSKVYEKDYMVRHMGYGVDPKTQLATNLSKKNIELILIGKVADIIINEKGKSFKNLVDTEKLMDITYENLKKIDTGVIFTNIQETDLSGHSQDVKRYAKTLEKFDEKLSLILNELQDDDILIISADHGNDPLNKSSKHTREYVPLLIYRKNNDKLVNIGIRETMSDTSATILEYFNIENSLEQGESYLAKLKI